MCVYTIPLISLFIFLGRKLNIQFHIILIALIGGWFIPSWLASFANDYGINLLQRMVSNKSLLDAWAPAIIAPFTEELLKGMCALGLIYLLNLSDKKSYFITGTCVGLGFQISEDISYIIQDSYEGINNVIPKAFLRASGAISSHWMYTGILLVGLYYLIHTNNKKKTIYLISFPIFLHFLWNSPLNSIEMNVPIISGILSTCIIFTFLKVYFSLEKQTI